ncbi:MAG TPA: sigma-70 family RNA polymerase sigma factor [Planctomycetota bacterium]|jgi:RNA polymerase sigma factor (sigma-70 family)
MSPLEEPLKAAILAYQKAPGDAAFDAVYQAACPVVRQMARETWCPTLQPDDIAQYAWRRIWQSLGAYDPARCGAVGWLYMVVKGAICTVLKAQRAQKNRRLRAYDPSRVISMYDARNGAEADREAHRDHERLREAVLDRAGLTSFERQAAALWLTGMDYTEVAAKLGIAYKRADNAIYRAVVKARRLPAEYDDVREIVEAMPTRRQWEAVGGPQVVRKLASQRLSPYVWVGKKARRAGAATAPPKSIV